MVSQHDGVGEKLRRMLRPYYNDIRSRLIFETNADYHHTVFLSAGARTGSTWISEVINHNRDYRFVMEPISMFCLLAAPKFESVLPNQSDGVSPFVHIARTWSRPAVDDRLLYIRPDCVDEDLVRRAADILSGRYRHPEVDQYNYTFRMFFSKRLVKETKSNLWVRWLYERFPGLKMILLTRHPVPTIQSRLYDKTSPSKDVRAPYFRKLIFGQPDLVEDYLRPFRDVLENAESVFEQRLAVWCIQNYVPLRQFSPGEIHIAFYEDFCLDPKRACRELLTYLGTPPNERQLEAITAKVQRPSSTAQGPAELGPVDPMFQLTKWQSRITPEDLSSADTMLRAFGLHQLYSSDDPLPKKDGLAALML